MFSVPRLVVVRCYCKRVIEQTAIGFSIVHVKLNKWRAHQQLTLAQRTRLIHQELFLPRQRASHCIPLLFCRLCLLLWENLLAIVLFRAVNRRLRKMAFADLLLGTVSLPIYIYSVGTEYRFWNVQVDGRCLCPFSTWLLIPLLRSPRQILRLSFLARDFLPCTGCLSIEHCLCEHTAFLFSWSGHSLSLLPLPGLHWVPFFQPKMLSMSRCLTIWF